MSRRSKIDTNEYQLQAYIKQNIAHQHQQLMPVVKLMVESWLFWTSLHPQCLDIMQSPTATMTH